MKKIFLFCFLGLFLISFVLAQGQGIHEPGTGIMNPELREAGQGTGQGLESNTTNQTNGISLEKQKKIRSGDYIGEKGEHIKIQEKSNNRMQIRVGNVSVDCDCEITHEQFQNRTKLKTMLSNGRNAEIKIMPDTASEIALNRLRLKVCSEENNCSIVLKEVGEGNESKLAYELKTQRQSKILGLFKTRMQVQAQVDAETGEVLQIKKPWWAFLASESE